MSYELSRTINLIRTFRRQHIEKLRVEELRVEELRVEELRVEELAGAGAFQDALQ